MNVRLSSKGQLVIPVPLRQALGLEPGAEMTIELVEDHLVLTPLERQAPEDALYGLLRDAGVLEALADEHRRELDRERDLRPR